MADRLWDFENTHGTNATGGAGGNVTATDGTKSQQLSLGVGNTVIYSNAHPRGGATGIYFDTSTSATSLVRLPFVNTVKQGAFRIYDWFDADPGTGVFWTVRHSGGTAIRLGLTTGDNLAIQNTSGTTIATSVGTVTYGQMWRIECLWDTATTTTGSCTFAVYAGDSSTPMATVSTTGANFSGNNVTHIDVGVPTTAIATDQHIDHILLRDGTTSLIGPLLPAEGTGTGAFTWAGAAVGDAPDDPPAEGSATGTFTWAGTAVGARTPKGSGSGTATWTGAATGKRAPKGSASGTATWTGAAVGKRTPKGSSSGAFTWAGAAVGDTPDVDSAEGSASGTYTYSGTATGKRNPKASATGTVAYVGAAVGKRTPKGAATGVATWAGAAVGKRTPKATGTGTFTWAGTATGAATPVGTAVGSYAYSGAAVGLTPTDIDYRDVTVLAVLDASRNVTLTDVSRAVTAADTSRLVRTTDRS